MLDQIPPSLGLVLCHKGEQYLTDARSQLSLEATMLSERTHERGAVIPPLSKSIDTEAGLMVA